MKITKKYIILDWYNKDQIKGIADTKELAEEYCREYSCLEYKEVDIITAAEDTEEDPIPTIDQVDTAIDILTKSGWLKKHDEEIYNDGFSYGHYMGCCDMKEELLKKEES